MGLFSNWFSTKKDNAVAKMFYTLDETKKSLGRNEDEIKQLSREGRLREFRDGPRLMFKADQVEALRFEVGVRADNETLEDPVPSGLLDLTKESDDTALGMDLLDEITGRESSPVVQPPASQSQSEAMAKELRAHLEAVNRLVRKLTSDGCEVNADVSQNQFSVTVSRRLI